MNITQLKYVLAIAGSSSMREAATKLYVTQPALSASIHDLEDEMGIQIFERTNRGISLTEAGREFLSYAKKAVNQYEILEDRYLPKGTDKERFSVSTQHYNFAIRAFADVIRRSQPEKYVFSLHETKTREVLNDVRSLKSEVGIVSFTESNEAVLKKLLREFQLEFTPLMERETYIYVWENHTLADREVVSIDELQEYPCISFDQGEEGNYFLAEEALADYSFDKMIMSDDRATSMEIIYELGGYSIGSGMLSQENVILRGLKAIKLKEEDPLMIGYIIRKGSRLSVYGQLYIEELSKYKDI